MADHRIWLAALLLALSATATAAELRDPTRPGWQPPRPTAATDKPTGNPLTAIIIGPQKRLALINGRYLAVGDRFGDAKLTQITFDYVVLRSASGERMLRLTPPLDSRSAAKVNGS